MVQKILPMKALVRGETLVKNFIGVGGKTFAFWQGKPDGEYLVDLHTIIQNLQS